MPMLVRNTFFSSLTLGLRFASSALVFILIARVLGAEEFGRFAFAISFTGIFMVLLDYGFNLYIVKEVAAEPGRAIELAKDVLGAKLLLSAASTVVLFFIVRGLGYPPATELMIYILWLSSILYSFGSFFGSVFRGLNRFQYETYPAIILNGVQVAVIAVLLLLGFKALSIAFAYLASRVLYFAVSYFYMKREVGSPGISFSLASSLRLFRETFPFGTHAILAAIYFQIDTVLLSLYRGDAEVGYYQAAMRLVIAAMLVYEIVVSSYYSVIAARFKSDPEGFRRDALSFNKYMLLIGGVFSSVLFIFPDLFIETLYGAGYGQSVILAQLLAIAILLRFLGGAYGVLLTVADNQNKRAMGVGVSVVFNIVLNMLLIPEYGAIGAAVASVLTHVVIYLMYYKFSWEIAGDNFLDAYCCWFAIALAACTALAVISKAYLPLATALVFPVIAAFLVFISLGKREKEAVQLLLKRFIRA